MTDAASKRKLPVKMGLFKPPGNGEPGHLIGSRCNSCQEYFHPRRVVCLNCYSEDLEEVVLSSRGKIYTYTIARTSYPVSPVQAPFISAYVELPEGVQVLTLITDLDLDKVEIGAEVEVYFWKVADDDQGNELTAYAFRPVST